MISIAKIIVKAALYLLTTVISAQMVTGSWSGNLDVQGTKIPLTFNITQEDQTYITTLDSPSQGAMGLATSSTKIDGKTIHIDASGLGIIFDGNIEGKSIKGTFKQNGMELPLTLTPSKDEINKPVRPQEPKKPYPYIEEEVTFINKNADNITLAGTLTLPKNVKKPAVAILISGSGPQNRNEELLGHKPFLVLADHLTRNGIAVLRYDDRGTSESKGDFATATSYDFATDVEAAMEYLKTRTDIDANKIGLIGHSEGGMIAPIVASTNKNVAFVVMLAGLGATGEEVLLTQANKNIEMLGASQDVIDFNTSYTNKIYKVTRNFKGESLKKELAKIFKEMGENAPEMFKSELSEAGIKRRIELFSSDWMLGLLNYNPQKYLSKVTCPILAINGEKDVQVDAKANLNGIETILKQANHKDFTTKELKDLNHLFQTSTTGAFSEYQAIEETFAPKALLLVSNWIKERF
ncbi:alpha/beta hydrolase family protein [Aquimarina rhabdastrellae]